MKKPMRVLTKDPVLNRILELMKHEGMTEKEMTRKLGLSDTVYTAWKYEERKSFLQYIGPMAERLKVSTNYLLYGKDEEVNGDTMSLTEIELVKRFRRMKP